MKAFFLGLGAMVAIGVISFVVLDNTDFSASSVYSTNSVRQ